MVQKFLILFLFLLSIQSCLSRDGEEIKDTTDTTDTTDPTDPSFFKPIPDQTQIIDSSDQLMGTFHSYEELFDWVYISSPQEYMYAVESQTSLFQIENIHSKTNKLTNSNKVYTGGFFFNPIDNQSENRPEKGCFVVSNDLTNEDVQDAVFCYTDKSPSLAFFNYRFSVLANNHHHTDLSQYYKGVAFMNSHLSDQVYAFEKSNFTTMGLPSTPVPPYYMVKDDGTKIPLANIIA